MTTLDALNCRAIWWNALGIGSLLLICAYAGLVVFAYYFTARCDPINAKVNKIINTIPNCT